MPANSTIAVRNLTYRYPGGLVALDGVTFSITDGERVGLIGPNGAGKTTLFLCLGGVLRVQPGVICLAGLDPADPQQRQALPANLGIVFQNSDDQIFNTTVFDDVAFGPLNLGLETEQVRRRVAEGLEEVGLKGFDLRVPFHLSGGEKRRVALAGVLAMQPQIFLLDEPSMFLDPRGRREFINLIQGFRATRIIASHDLELIRATCQRVILLDGGRLVADGEVVKILADAALMNGHGLEVPHSLSHHDPGHQHHV
jgi:cobalt/nickel transport system ATP-binding protein